MSMAGSWPVRFDSWCDGVHPHQGERVLPEHRLEPHPEISPGTARITDPGCFSIAFSTPLYYTRIQYCFPPIGSNPCNRKSGAIFKPASADSGLQIQRASGLFDGC
jgi:hypothetical protein